MTMLNPTQEKDVICVVNPDEKYRLSKYCGFDTSIMVTPYDVQNLKEKGYILPQIKESHTYSLHPDHDKVYIELNEQVEDNIVLERVNRISTIISLLGGKRMQVLATSLKLNDINKSIEGSIKGEQPVGTVEVSGTRSMEEKKSIENDIKYEVIWIPGNYTVDSYEQAKKLVEKYRMDNDTSISDIMRQRDPSHPNPMKHKTLHVDVRNDLERLRNIAIDLQGKLKAQNLDIEISGTPNCTSKVSRHNTFDITVEFGELVPTNNTPNEDVANKDIKIRRKIKRIQTIINIAIVLGIAAGVLLMVLL